MRETDRGQYKLRLPLPVYNFISAQAKANKRTINAEICFHLENVMKGAPQNATTTA